MAFRAIRARRSTKSEGSGALARTEVERRSMAAHWSSAARLRTASAAGAARTRDTRNASETTSPGSAQVR